jgi:cardiolipin synthase
MELLSWIVIAINVLVAPLAAWHVLLYKRDPRAAMGWISVCVLFPIAGPLLYFLLGINRVENRALALRDGPRPRRFIRFKEGVDKSETVHSSTNNLRTESQLKAIEPRHEFDMLSSLERSSAAITGLPLLPGNRVTILYDGEQTYSAMLQAIEQASQSIDLMSYIFSRDEVGRRFVDALEAASKRGVQVRVMIDAMGELYSFPPVGLLLRKKGIKLIRFHPFRIVPPSLALNLRNHRKILVTDGRIGFTGGINIGMRHIVRDTHNRRPTKDIHFRIEGPVVAQLAAVYNNSWKLAGGEPVPPIAEITTQMASEDAGPSQCRVIEDGPDENFDKLEKVMFSAIGAANKSIRIMTPYFLPSREMIAVLQNAVLHGVQVTIILPQKSNLAFVDWASRNMLWELLCYNVEVLYQPAPFAHSKLFLVDGNYLIIGSANIDARSLKLNYELNLEIFDPELAHQLERQFDHVAVQSKEITLEEIDSRSLLMRTRDAFCWLFSPYL